jgi:Ser/Thr protein kinase RdoA (MazF antagonist)
LAHLAARGFEGAPRSLGADEAGREVFSYLEGEVPSELGFIDDQALCAAAMLIRKLHDLSADLVGTSAAKMGVEVICHNDLSPCNFAFRDGLPVAMIDFDAASPGARAHDLGYAAWLWLDFGSREVDPAEQRRRLRLFAEAYGGITPDAVLRSMMERQRMLIAEGQRQRNRDMSDWAAECLEWTRRHALELIG